MGKTLVAKLAKVKRRTSKKGPKVSEKSGNLGFIGFCSAIVWRWDLIVRAKNYDWHRDPGK
jgi:hypothetical protein